MLKGLIALCPACHEVKHIGYASTRGRLGVATVHLAKVNGITLPEAQEYVKAIWRVWQERSRYEWKLDVSWLGQYGIVQTKVRG